MIILDQFTKLMVVVNIPLHYSIRVIDGFFNITHIRNSGVAFGLFAGQGSDYKALFFVAISTIAVIAILAFFHQTPDDRRMVQTGLILIFSGAIGNMIDRLVHKEVIDFLDFFYRDFSLAGLQCGRLLHYHWGGDDDSRFVFERSVP
ncbi:MAG: signal peptidase II [Nitrospinota bacterium]|nr:signal peptidase II [Nitrospinota bacterium]